MHLISDLSVLIIQKEKNIAKTMSDTKPETQNADTITGGASFGSRVKAHFRKWWWIYVIVFIIVVLVVVLPV